LLDAVERIEIDALDDLLEDHLVEQIGDLAGAERRR
jgi:hypothetical protein